ncbi:MAG: signal recognition particle-docking protein FtsY [Cyanobacteria bacterium J06623_4]
MAAFNWFERSYKAPTEESQNETAQNAENADDQAEKDSPVSSEDYLNWAKAAYQNIQARQQEEVGTEEVGTEEVDAEEVSTKEASQDQKIATDSDSSTTDANTPTPETPSETASEIAPSDTSAETDAPAEGDVAEPAQAFWAKAQQAQAEREERLERLQAEAILEPEPEPKPAAPETQFVPVDIDLDEAFLWSAEVLASQGRRPDQISIEEITWLNKLRQGLDKTRRGLVNQLKSIVGQGPLNDEAVDEIEALLLQADVGVAATDKIISSLQTKLREETLPPEQAISYLKSLLRDMLEEPLQGKHNLTFTPEKDKLSIWLMTGVNGAGKTTTIGKLAHIATKSDFKCLIGAADTFRAAAVEQVKVWGARSGVEVIANPGQNTDPAAVVFDAISAAKSREIELLLVDTAGRLQNKKNLMDELSKVRKIIDKKAPDANVESLLVLDATLGQNGLRQAQVFAEAAQLSGVVLTKLDGTARGGVALAVVQQLGLPIRFIGAGEGIEDLRPFSSYEFVEALLNG